MSVTEVMTRRSHVSFIQTYSRGETINRGTSGRTRVSRRKLRAHELVVSWPTVRPSKPTTLRPQLAQQPQPRLSSQIPYGECYRLDVYPPSLVQTTQNSKQTTNSIKTHRKIRKQKSFRGLFSFFRHPLMRTHAKLFPPTKMTSNKKKYTKKIVKKTFA